MPSDVGGLRNVPGTLGSVEQVRHVAVGACQALPLEGTATTTPEDEEPPSLHKNLSADKPGDTAPPKAADGVGAGVSGPGVVGHVTAPATHVTLPTHAPPDAASQITSPPGPAYPVVQKNRTAVATPLSDTGVVATAPVKLGTGGHDGQSPLNPHVPAARLHVATTTLPAVE